MFADRGKLALERGEMVEITLVSGMSFLGFHLQISGRKDKRRFVGWHCLAALVAIRGITLQAFCQQVKSS